MLPESALVDAIVDHLTANRPAALGSGVTVRREGDTAGVDSPKLVVAATGTQTDGHPAVLRLEVTISLDTQTDDTTTADSEAWIVAVRQVTDTAAFRNAIRVTLYDSDLILRKFVAAGNSLDPAAGQRMRSHQLVYSAMLQTALPVTSG